MARVTKVQAAHTYGILDKHLAERTDTKFVNGSLSDGLNIIMLPQGGYMDRGGSTDFGRLRRKMALQAFTAPMASLPNGGTAADLVASTPITTAAAAGSRFVLAEIDFGAPTALQAIDIGKVKAGTSGGNGALIAEYWTGSAWATFGTAQSLSTTARSRRIVAGKPGTANITASKFRVAVDAALAVGPISFAGMALWSETASLSDVALWKHSPDKAVNCTFAVTENHVDVFHDGIWTGCFAMPVSEAIVRQVKPEARFASILAFHQDLEPQQATALGSVAEWSCDPVPFENVPLVDYGAVYANGATEKQEIAFYSFSTGEKFELTLEGLTTTAITFDTNNTIRAANVQAALEALSNVDPGLTVTATSPIVVEFTGGRNDKRDWLAMSSTALDNNGYVRVRTIQQGKAGGEPIMSAARGWPAVGRFAQQRLIMAGLKSRPTDILATQSGSSTDLNNEVGIASAGLSYEVEGSANNAIRDIAVSRTLIFLGDEQVSYLAQTTGLSATDAPRFGSSDAPGVDPDCPTVSSDNALFYVQAGGNTLRILSYTELEQNYIGDNASVLSAQLINGVSWMTRRRAVGAIDSDLIIMGNADGSITVLTMMRTQEVSGFSPWATDGAYVSGVVDNGNMLWLAVRRSVNGTDEIRLERQDPDGMLDEVENRSHATPARVLNGLSRFNGRSVWVKANDTLQGPYAVSGGTVTLDAAVTGAVQIGTWIAPFATDHAYRPETEQQYRMARQKRVNRVQLSLVNTTNVALSVNGGAVFDVPLVDSNDLRFGEGELARPFTGRREVEGMHGFTPGAEITVTQTRPGKLLARAVAKDIAA